MIYIKGKFELGSLDFMLEAKNNTPTSHIPGRVFRPKPQIIPRGPIKGHQVDNKKMEALMPPVSHETIDIGDVYGEVFSKINPSKGKRGGR